MVNKYHAKTARDYLVDIQAGILYKKKRKKAGGGRRKVGPAKDRNYLGGQ